MSVDLATARAFLAAAGFGETPAQAWTELTGGVSSDLWRVETARGPVCVKSALERLRVADDWRAPLDRNAVECAYLRWAATVCPDNVPQVLADDAELGLFVMEYLPPHDHPVWKSQLLAGTVDPAVAAAVGSLIGRLHAASADDATARRTFATDGNFAQLRLEPYLRVTATRHRDLAQQLHDLADRTASHHRTVVHGDLSPKNILVGPAGPVLLDAECAWFGDPAFDIAFCLNHLVLKSVVRPDRRDALGAAVDELLLGYRGHVAWESLAELDTRVATLLPALLLARVDGSSPVEYLDEPQRHAVRAVARERLAQHAAVAGPYRPQAVVRSLMTALGGASR